MTSKVLAAEDSLVQRERLRADLTAAGFEVVLATDGHEALERLRDGIFDLVVTDIVMPGMDGYELCGHVKKAYPQLPVVLLTSLSDPAEIVRGLEAGADTFLRKPYDRAQLVTRLHRVLQRQMMRSHEGAARQPEAVLRGQRFQITADRQQILDLLVASFEDLVDANDELHRREDALTATRDELHHQLAATERQRRYLDTLISATPQAMVITDEKGVITGASERLATLLQTHRGALVGQSIFEQVQFTDSSGHAVASDQRPIGRVLQGAESGDVEMGTSFDLLLATPDGPVPVIARAAAVTDRSGAIVAAVSALHEIGALAAHDPVTKLPKHLYFMERVAQAATASTEECRTYAVLAVAIDRLTHVRARLSPSGAEQLLAELASRVRRLLDEDEVTQRTTLPSAAYFGDDLFGVVLPCLKDEVDGVRIAHLVAERLTGPVDTGDVTIEVTTTVAAAFDGSRAMDPVALVSAATTAAMDVSKHGGATVKVIDPTVSVRASDQLRREVELREAIDTGALEVHYQPQVDARDGTPIAVEALVRWRHPDHGLLSPAQFIPLAEETGLIVPLGWCVLREACRQAAQWRRELPGAEALTVSVNLAPSQLRLATAADTVNSILAETGLPACALVLEVTEGEVVSDVASAAERLHALAATGVRIALDDFGTGYSSLLQLRRFPFHALKVDRGFVAGMTEEPEDAAIVSASVRLAHALDLEVVAEGVETTEQLAQLQILECELAQGFLWAPALHPAALERWWSEQTVRAREAC